MEGGKKGWKWKEGVTKIDTGGIWEKPSLAPRPPTHAAFHRLQKLTEVGWGLGTKLEEKLDQQTSRLQSSAAIFCFCIVNTHPVLKTSASLRKAALMRIGNGNRPTRVGNLTMASHCSPTLLERRPTQHTHTHKSEQTNLLRYIVT